MFWTRHIRLSFVVNTPEVYAHNNHKQHNNRKKNERRWLASRGMGVRHGRPALDLFYTYGHPGASLLYESAAEVIFRLTPKLMEHWASDVPCSSQTVPTGAALFGSSYLAAPYM